MSDWRTPIICSSINGPPIHLRYHQATAKELDHSKSLSNLSLSLVMSRDPLVVGNVIGDVLDQFIQTASFGVMYNNKEIMNGSELKPSVVAKEPRVEIRGHDMRTLYTLVST